MIGTAIGVRVKRDRHRPPSSCHRNVTVLLAVSYFVALLLQTILRFSAPHSAYLPQTNLQDWMNVICYRKSHLTNLQDWTNVIYHRKSHLRLNERNLLQKKPFVGIQELWEWNFKICHRREPASYSLILRRPVSWGVVLFCPAFLRPRLLSLLEAWNDRQKWSRKWSPKMIAPEIVG